jgi:chemotaxis protein CheY-P-specific phosphatase CheC
MNEKSKVTGSQKKILENVAADGISRTLQSLSKISGRQWKVLDRKTEFHNLSDAWKIFPFDDTVRFGGELVYSGQMPMSFVCIFPQNSVVDITEYINRRSETKTKKEPVLEKMTIAEVSNILTNGFLGVIANKLKMSMLIATPSVSVGSKGYLLKKAVSKAGLKSGHVLASRLFLQSDNLTMDALFVVVLSSDSFTTLVEKISGSSAR